MIQLLCVQVYTYILYLHYVRITLICHCMYYNDICRHIQTYLLRFTTMHIIIVFQYPSFNGTTTTFISVSTRDLPLDSYQVQCEASNSLGTSSVSVYFVIVQVLFDGKYISVDISTYIVTCYIISALWHYVYRLVGFYLPS